MAAGTGIFFHKAQLRRGSTMALSFPAEPEPPILTRDVAEKVPFANLDDVLAAFNIAPGSAEAANVAATLRLCTSPPNPGEVKACTTSLEATVRRSMDMLGAAADGDHDVWAATSRVPDDRRTSGLLPRQTYRVEAVATLDGDRYVGCHKLPFPYRVYQCHMTAGLTDKAYVVSLRGIGGGGGLTTADMLAFCHHDTARWNPAHPAFELLHTHPGTPVCHFMPYANPLAMQWVAPPIILESDCLSVVNALNSRQQDRSRLSLLLAEFKSLVDELKEIEWSRNASFCVSHSGRGGRRRRCGAATLSPSLRRLGSGSRPCQLRPGSTMDISFPSEPEPAILPRDVAEKDPFGNLTDVLAAFSIPAGSTEAANVSATLSLCQSPPRAGELKACTCITSLEGTVRSAMDMLGARGEATCILQGANAPTNF
ncbi:hypothetical protein EJB05_57846, partial [Eragrostis curvula]